MAQAPQAPASAARAPTSQEVTTWLLQELMPLFNVPSIAHGFVRSHVTGRAWSPDERARAAHALRRAHQLIGYWIEHGGVP